MKPYIASPAKSRQSDDLLTAEELRASGIIYDPPTGNFTHHTYPPSTAHLAGRALGTVAGNGYVVIRVNGVLRYAHRLALLWVNGHLPVDQVDHLDGDRTNNAIWNLAEVTRWENQQNTVSRKGSSSRFLGVSRHPTTGKWRAQITANRLRKFLGEFTCELAARDAYLAAKAELHTYCPVPRDLVFGEVANV